MLLAPGDYSSAAELDNTQAECNQVRGRGGVISISPPISPKITVSNPQPAIDGFD